MTRTDYKDTTTPKSFRESKERIKAKTEDPQFRPEQIKLFYSDYVDGYDSALAALEKKEK